LIANIAVQTLLNVSLWTKGKLHQGFLVQLLCSKAVVVQNFLFDQRDSITALEQRIKVGKFFSDLDFFYLFSDRLAFWLAYAQDAFK
jgi:hypothetical protein